MFHKQRTDTSAYKEQEKNRINLDYDFNTEYGDGDIPDIDKPSRDYASADDDERY